MAGIVDTCFYLYQAVNADPGCGPFSVAPLYPGLPRCVQTELRDRENKVDKKEECTNLPVPEGRAYPDRPAPQKRSLWVPVRSSRSSSSDTLYIRIQSGSM